MQTLENTEPRVREIACENIAPRDNSARDSCPVVVAKDLVAVSRQCRDARQIMSQEVASAVVLAQIY